MVFINENDKKLGKTTLPISNHLYYEKKKIVSLISNLKLIE